MSDSATVSLFTEGQVSLPDGYIDRTVTVFTPQGNAPAFNISRDVLQNGEMLADYIDRQVRLMEKHLKGWKKDDRLPAVLGNDLLKGECVHASYLQEGKRIWQQQAVFSLKDGKILVFTMSSLTKLTREDSVTFETLLQSFRFHVSQ